KSHGRYRTGAYSYGRRRDRRTIRRARRSSDPRGAAAAAPRVARGWRRPPRRRRPRRQASGAFHRHFVGERQMSFRRIASLSIILGTLLAVSSASAEKLITSVSTHRVLINSSFTGTDLVLFGSIEDDEQPSSQAKGYDLVVTVRGPGRTYTARRKDRVLGL